MDTIRGNCVTFIDNMNDSQARVELSCQFLDFDYEILSAIYFTRKETEYLRKVNLRVPGERVHDTLYMASVAKPNTVKFSELVDYKNGVFHQAKCTEELQLKQLNK